MYTVNENKQEYDDCSVSVFEGDSALATTIAAVQPYPAPDATPVLAPTGGDDDDELALARRHIVLLQQRIISTVAAGKALHGEIAKLAAQSTTLSKAAADTSCVAFVTLDPTNSIQTITNTSATVSAVLI